MRYSRGRKMSYNFINVSKRCPGTMKELVAQGLITHPSDIDLVNSLEELKLIYPKKQ
jgi:hypothetical protein